MRARRSSAARLACVPTLALLFTAGTALLPARDAAAQGAPTPSAAALDTLRQRLEDAEAALAMLREQLATESGQALRTRSRVSLELSGRALVHLFANDGRTNNADLPLFTRPDSGTGPQGGLGMGIRQTRLALAFGVRDVVGGDFTGDIDVDFFGGQQPSSGGRTFPLLRLRTLRGVLTWRHAELLVGQEQPLVAGLNPVSLASVGTSGFATAGNLWLWLPQVRGTVQTAGRVRLGVQGAVLAPTSGDPTGSFDTGFDAAERTGIPYLQGQVRAAWGEGETEGLVAVGVHAGRVADATDVERESRAVTATWLVPLGRRLEVRGEAFDGQALRGLGGGGIGQGIGVGGVPVRSRGGWAQLNVRPTARLLLGVGAGFDDPEDADVGPAGRTKNAVTEAHLHWRPGGPLVLGLEWRRLATTTAGTTWSGRHLNFAAGFEF